MGLDLRWGGEFNPGRIAGQGTRPQKSFSTPSEKCSLKATLEKVGGFSWPTPDSEILTLDTKVGDATGVRIYESSHEGSCDEMHQCWQPPHLGGATRGRGADRKVTLKFIPRATQDAKLPPVGAFANKSGQKKVHAF